MHSCTVSQNKFIHQKCHFTPHCLRNYNRQAYGKNSNTLLDAKTVYLVCACNTIIQEGYRIRNIEECETHQQVIFNMGEI